ncbi:hypothetical protein BC342_12040 [Streptomyces olivaceus]|nr:hypothetical protein BC342_12040 [Streptomyces olivaceus]
MYFPRFPSLTSGCHPHVSAQARTSDAPHGTVFPDSAAQLTHFRRPFRRVRDQSLSPEASRDLIRELAKEL